MKEVKCEPLVVEHIVVPTMLHIDLDCTNYLFCNDWDQDNC